MNENKPVTAEEIARKVVEKNEGYSFRDTEWIKERGVYIFSHLEEIAEEYATLKTQQLTDRINSLEDSLTICDNSRNWNKDKVQQLTAENERLREDVKTRIKNQAELAVKVVKLTTENERLREAFKKVANDYSRLRWVSKDERDEMYITLLKQAGINLTHKD